MNEVVIFDTCDVVVPDSNSLESVAYKAYSKSLLHHEKVDLQSCNPPKEFEALEGGYKKKIVHGNYCLVHLKEQEMTWQKMFVVEMGDYLLVTSKTK